MQALGGAQNDTYTPRASIIISEIAEIGDHPARVARTAHRRALAQASAMLGMPPKLWQLTTHRSPTSTVQKIGKLVAPPHRPEPRTRERAADRARRAGRGAGRPPAPRGASS